MKKEKNLGTNDLRIFMPHDLMNGDISVYSLATYGVLQMLATTTHMNIQCVTPYQIAFLLTGNKKQTKYTLGYIKNSLDELFNENIIEKLGEGFEN